MPTSSSSKSSKRTPSKTTRAQRDSDTRELSKERDENYDLISVLYHGLQGADQCTFYAHDAEEAGDRELAIFLREAGEAQADLAKKAKHFLMQRLSGAPATGNSGTRAHIEEDDEDDDDDDSSITDYDRDEQ